MAVPRRGSLGLLFAILFVVMLGFSIMFPVLPQYARGFGADSFTLSLLLSTYSVMQFVFAPLWGRLSDRVGRRPVLLVGLAGYAISFTVFGLARSLAMLFVARALAGILSSATLPTATAYIADTTPEQDRARGMGILGAAFGLGVIFGPFLGGILARYGLAVPFFVGGGIAALMWLMVLLVLPESLTAGGAASQQPGGRNLVAAVRSPLGALYVISFIVSFALAGLEAIFGYFALVRLGLVAERIWPVFLAMGVVGALVQGGLVGPLIGRLGEPRVLAIGLLVSAAGFLLVPLSANTVTAAAYLSVFAAGSGLVRPSVTTLISRRAGDRQGTYIGIMDSFDSLGRIAGPPLAGYLYRLAAGYPFWVGAALNLAALAVFACTGGRAQPSDGKPRPAAWRREA